MIVFTGKLRRHARRSLKVTTPEELATIAEGSGLDDGTAQVQCSIKGEAVEEPSAVEDLVQLQADTFDQPQEDVFTQSLEESLRSLVLPIHKPLLVDVDANASKPSSLDGDKSFLFHQGGREHYATWWTLAVVEMKQHVQLFQQCPPLQHHRM